MANNSSFSSALSNVYAQRAAERKYQRELKAQEEAQRAYEKAVAEQAAAQAAAEEEKNKGGFFGGLGYLGEKIGLGFLSGIEGIWDYTAGGLAKLFGADDWAEQQIANDWVNYNHADEWYNPSKGWQVAGDVAGGIGTSLPAIAGVAAAAAIAYFSGGSLSGVSAGIISGVIAGLGAAGNATKEAYKQTGELGGKEFGYGALVGLTEGTIEGVSGAIGAGTGAIAKNITKSFGKEVAESAVRQTLGKTVIKGFVGEAFEEGVATLLDPYWKRITYDPEAKNATFQEVAYSALVGGLSGAIMSGADVSVRNVSSMNRGNTLVSEGRAADVISTAESLSAYQAENQTDYESFQLVQNILSELQTSMQGTGGQVETIRQKMLLGALEQANTTAAFEPFIATSAENIYNNAEAVAERMTAYGYTDTNGKPIQITAEQIREGIDTSSVKAFRQSMSKALRTNSALRGLAVIDATGRLTLDTAKFADSTLRGQQLSSRADLNRFIESASDSELAAVGEKLGIESWETLTNEDFQAKIGEFVYNGGVETYQQEHTLVNEARNIDPTAAKKTLPRMVNLKNDGSYRYTQGNTDIAIIKRGDSYRIFDYDSGRMSKSLTRSEVNKALREIHTNEANVSEAARVYNEQQNQRREQLAQLDTYARENIDGYSNLNAPNQAAIRAIIRQGRAAGVSEDFVMSCARVSARSGLNIVFSKEQSFVAANGTYADGAIDLKNNRIIINPEAKSRTGEMILIHELTHAIYRLDGGVLQVAEGAKTMTAEEKEKIRSRYAAVGQGGAVDVADEINAHFAEQTLANKNILERLAVKKPTLKEKIINFFKGAKSAYKGDTKLAGAAARLYKQYKKLFDEFASRNQQRNSVETPAATTSNTPRFALTPYSDRQKENWKNSKRIVIYENDTQLREIVQQSLTDKQFDKKIYFGAVDSELAKFIKEKTGLDLENYNCSLQSDEIRKIIRDHSSEKKEQPRGQRPVTEEDIINIPNVMQDPTDVLLSTKLYDGKPAVHFVQRRGNEKTTVVAVVSDKHLDLRVQTEYVGVKKRNLATPTDEQASINTPKASSGTVSNTIISKKSEKVNTKTAKTAKKFALPTENSDGEQLSAAQRAFFADSKIVDEQGKLLVVYHGTPEKGFYEFSKKFIGSRFSFDDRGFFFIDRKSIAEDYSTPDFDREKGRVLPCYILGKKPLVINKEYLKKNGYPARALTDNDCIDFWDAFQGAILDDYDAAKADSIIVDDGISKMVVAFEPNQIKLTTNKNPSKHNDIRYALEIDGETTPVDVEEGKNLVALHNLSEEKLMKVLQLGGFPMPSIAITRVDLGHDQFGGITVVFGRETIDPRSDSRNKVFSRDGYTPTVPKIDYKVNDTVLLKISKKYKEIKDKFGYEEARPLYNYVNDMERALENNEGEFSTISKLYDNVDVMQVFLLDTKGKKIEPVYKDITENLPQERVAYLERFIKYFGKEAIAELTPPSGVPIFTYRHQYVDKYRDRLVKFYAEEFELSEADITESMRDIDLVQTVLDARKYLKNGASQTKSVYDSTATEQKIRKAAPEKEYRAWVDSLFEGIQEKTGIRNDKDMFTSMGNRRSFEATHDDYTLENLVKAMKKAPTKGDSGFVGVSANSLAAKLAREFRSVSEIRKNAGSLKAFNQDIQDNFIDTARAMINEIEGMLAPQAANGVRGWTELDGASTIIGEIADRGYTTEKQIADFMAREYKNTSYKYSEAVGNKILALFDYVRAMSDTDYFEAKPRRAVSLNEIKMILVPEGANSKLLERLSEKHIPYKVYGNTAEQRTAAIKRLDGVRFALPASDSEGRELSPQQREYFRESKVVNDKGHLIPVYHGTPSMFTVFDINKLGQNTMMFSEGAGFYFTDKKEIAAKYASSAGANGNIMQVYLNITKPMTTEQAEFTDRVRKNIFKALYEYDKNALSNYSDVEYEGVNAALNAAVDIESSCETDIDFIASLINGGVTDRQVILDTITKITGYDGVMNRGIATATNRDYMVYVAFNSKQAKNVDNTAPTEAADIRYALPETDSEGTQLSDQQREFFADSRVVDAEGKLLMVYHGTRKADFTQFRRNINYFTDSREMADSYSPNGEKFTGYLKITKPFIVDAGGEKWSKIPVDEQTKALVEKYGGSVFKEGGKWRTTPADLASAIESGVDEGELDYDGIIIKSVDDTGSYNKTSETVVANDYIVFNSNQFKNADNRAPTASKDIRYALTEDENPNENLPNGALSRGQRARFAANNTGMRVYSREDATDVINSIIEERLVFEDLGLYGELKGKAKNEVIDYLFTKLNTTKEGYRAGVALKIADFMIEHTVLTDMYADTDNTAAMTTLSILRRYMHRIDTRSIKGEIAYRYDKKNTIHLLWGAKKGEPAITPDTLGDLLAEEGIQLDGINGADLFFQMLDMYESAKAEVNKRVEEVMLDTYGNKVDINNLRQAIARDVLNAYDQKGKKSKFAKLVEKYTAEIESLKQRVRELKAENKLLNSIVDKAQKMKDLKLGTFLNSTQYKIDIFKKSVETLAKIKNRGNFNIAGTRKIMADLRTWYTKDNPILADSYEEGIAEMLDTIANGKKNYTTDELKMINNVMAYFTNFVEKFNKVYRQGKWVEAIPEATRYINTIHENETLKVGLFRKVAGSTYMQTFGDPMTVARRMDMYENGFYTEMLQELREAAIDAEITEMEVKTDYEEFMRKHKKYLSEITKQKVKYRGVDVPRSHLIGLYMTLKRSHSHAGLVYNGFSFVDTDGKRVRVQGFAPDAASDVEFISAVARETADIESMLSAVDKEYVAILEKGYNTDAKKLKADRDMQRLGFTNATEGYYYPIRRGNIARNVDTSDIQGELDRVSSSSFNKDTVRGAKQELFIESADVVYNRHIHAVCQYAALSPAIETYNRLYNMDISGNPNRPVSVATESANTWAKGNRYFSKLISDIQGIPSSSSEGMKALSFIRGSYAKFQLGANPKVWVTQLSSLFSSSSILDADSITKGVFISAKGVDKYCPLAKLRNSDNTAAMAQGVMDKVGKVSNIFMAPIGKMDRFVVCRLFGACQVQVAKNGGAKVGTEANKVEAGKLLRRVILETQQNSIATERSAAMRSGNEVMRTFTMFTSDSMKVIGRVIDSVGELATLRSRLKAATDPDVQAALKKRIKVAKRNVRKSVTALVMTALFMAGVAQLFRWLYNKDQDEDETVLQTVMVDFVGNLFGGLPLIKDIYARLAEGYDVDNYAYSAINDLLDSAANLFEAAKNLVSGEATSQEIASSVKSLSYSVGQMFGIPTRNLYNVFYGLTKRVSPTTAYQIDNVFYEKNYATDLNKAIESDDTEMIGMLMSLLLNERVGDDMNDSVRKKLSELYKGGYSVLPRSINGSITYNNETITLNDAELSRFKSIYTKANSYLEKMVESKGFKALTAEQQAKAIKQLYDAYYYKAISDLLGVDAETTVGTLSAWISIDKLAVANAALSGIESDKDDDGNTISGSRKKKFVAELLKQNLSDGERLLILCYKGYSIQNGDYKGYSAKRAKLVLLKYILSLKSATQAEKVAIAEECGFTVKNGKIIRDSLYTTNK